MPTYSKYCTHFSERIDVSVITEPEQYKILQLPIYNILSSNKLLATDSDIVVCLI